VRRFFVIQENLERARWRSRCIKECATVVAQVTGALLNATRLRALEVMEIYLLFYMCHFAMGLTHCYKTTVFYIYITME